MKVYDVKTVIILTCLTIFSLVCSLGGTLTSGNPWQAILVAWISFAGFLGATIAFTYTHTYLYHFKDAHGIMVTWDHADHSVRQEEFVNVVEEMLQKMEYRYPTARLAIRDSIVRFREPVWFFGSRKVAGLQDEQIISVGWAPILSNTALAHELAHLILQVCAGDPGEEYGHKVMKELGVA